MGRKSLLSVPQVAHVRTLLEQGGRLAHVTQLLNVSQRTGKGFNETTLLGTKLMARKLETWMTDIFPGQTEIYEKYRNLPDRELVVIVAASFDIALADLLTNGASFLHTI